MKEMQADLTQRLLRNGYIIADINTHADIPLNIALACCGEGMLRSAVYLKRIISLGGWPFATMTQWLSAWMPALHTVGSHAVDEHTRGLACIMHVAIIDGHDTTNSVVVTTSYLT
jgi:hypothetical protein